MDQMNFTTEIVVFFSYIQGLKSSLPVISHTLEENKENSRHSLADFLEKKSISKKQNEEDKSISYQVPIEYVNQFKRLSGQLNNAVVAAHMVPESFVVTLVSQYDAFLRSLLYLLYIRKPGLINASEKTFTFTEISNFSSIEDARNLIIDNEIDSIMRESHLSQLRWLEKKIGIPLTKDLDVLPLFIEITERRNLFVHTGGKVTNQYMKVCSDANVNLNSSIKIGDKLIVDQEYFELAANSILELGVKLAHVLWRKISEDEIEYADQNINFVCYELLLTEEYLLALSILKFATETIKKHSSEESKLYLLINKAQAYKWAGCEKECNEVLDSIDWSTKSLKYLLSRHVLRDEYLEAETIMRQIGKDGEIKIYDYLEWPLFQKFRETNEFRNAYLEIFGADYQVTPWLNDD